MREKNLLSSLKHANIIELLDTAQDEKNLYFIFESGTNGTLDDLIKITGGIKEPVAKIMFA
jgi:serine/threonine protein kinase|tara:strand:+ start:352 stop:534 length:183 start_codon:yes stop_codon:yes gene_type:complete